MNYFKNKNENELIKKIDRNDREAPLFEPFCESGFQVRYYLITVMELEILTTNYSSTNMI